ncbi:hypothetical protein Vadar_013411 [Vaccinium darrowii]|uniref:Uncharacterized protein n=1 Tax=Vaccinium darrowii TaxID=229202 RepID=A0ACB7XQG2_9ERIC|nr:hypothetical protein Vadar_013411 [Vaccinium darrowii]
MSYRHCWAQSPLFNLDAILVQLRIIKEENVVDRTSSEEIKEAVTEIDTDGDDAIDLHDLHPWPSTVDLHPWPSPSTSSISSFWSDEGFSGTFSGRNPCYFNTGVMGNCGTSEEFAAAFVSLAHHQGSSSNSAL